MIFRQTELAGLTVIDLEMSRDQRGHFARTWCRDEFAAHGIDAEFTQCGASFNHRRGTLRGLHFQIAPHDEAKLIRCTRGRVYDVAVDLRPGSPTRGQWRATELCAETGRMIYIPSGFAHGFQTLDDDSELFYQITAAYRPEAARGVRWDDPSLAIPWPVEDPILSARDRALPPITELLGEALASC
jgi:dTDP-4-dehydrorhamnose 3,5-epimerase